MVELLGALAVPVGKLLLKYGLGADAADVGGSLFQLAFKRLGEREKAAEAEGKARAVGEAVVADLGQALKVERGKEHDLRAAAEELAVTIGEHVRAELVIGQRLDPARIEAAILAARPVGPLFPPGDPALGYYRQLVAALAPRLRAVADGMAGYAVARDADILGMLDGLSRTMPDILAGVREIVSAQREEAARRRGEVETHEGLYRARLEEEVRKLTLFGVDLDERTPHELPLSIAYIPLQLRLGRAGGEGGPQLAYPEVLAALPLLGDRLLIEGGAGSGKTTLTQWTAYEVLRIQDGRARKPAGLAELLDRRADVVDSIVRLSGKALIPALQDVIRAGPHRRGSRRRLAGIDSGAWHTRTPFLVKLRLCPDGILPLPKDLPS